MIKEINRDIFLLSQKSAPATENDRQTGEDLLETLIANSEHCVGMAANMTRMCSSSGIPLYVPLIINQRE